jgi:hypothetical protein
MILLMLTFFTLGGAAFSADAIGETSPLPPLPLCPEGCTPDYWKNHKEAWVGYSPSTLLGSLFAALNDLPRTDALHGLNHFTLLQALEFKGGTGTRGAAKILLRQAVAGLLNAAHPEVDDIVSPADLYVIQGKVNTALSGYDRSAMLILAGKFEGVNELCSVLWTAGRTLPKTK